MSLESFVRESNKIEGTLREPTMDEVEAHNLILNLRSLDIPTIVKFVSIVQPGAVLRTQRGVNVRVGGHIAPPGGPGIATALEGILGLAQTKHPFDIHREYETLHPFTDGNGRSGRMTWLWMMAQRGQLRHALQLGFLHIWYYQSLEAGRG
jgi:hypothetical protein